MIPDFAREMNLEFINVACYSCDKYQKGCPILKEMLSSEEALADYRRKLDKGACELGQSFKAYAEDDLIKGHLSGRHPQHGAIYYDCSHHEEKA